ncbi:S-layer protein [Thermus scotoductus]|uniref:S-layer protein n=1 Tax=Thermus scotoductus TaxID=37636 RepID=A0A430UJJ7_THESC|nr:S-layer homology domain-containing protein [Thermus scotoductus]RTI03076.1 S-layer protein [Thermus scotoductus]
MKKRLVMLLAGLLTVLSMGFGLAQFSDVPAGHWAKEAVEALAAKGLVVGFPDGTFRGNENLTRYQAALIIYRLLQQIEGELKAKGESPTMQAMDPKDLEALKNAVQELAAELAALGVRVSALEDSAATKEDIARLEAMIQELKAQPAPEPGMDQAALKDLAERVEAASIAADTALAQAQQLAEQLDALAQDVEGVKGDVAALSTQVESNAQAIQALNELAVLLNQDVLSLQDRVTALEKSLADLQGVNFEQFATKEDVAAVQEFAAALRSDLVGLSEKVAKLEGQVAELSKVQYSISGSLTATYGMKTLAGTDFDIDRLFSTPFSTGVFGASQVASSVILGDVASANLSGGSLSLTLGVKNTAPAATGVAVSEASAVVQVPVAFGTSFSAAPTVRVNAATVRGSVDGQAFSVAYSRAASSFKFNDYLFVNDSDPAGRETRQGVVATFTGSKLPLTPTVTVVAGVSAVGGAVGDDGGTGGNLQGNYFGFRFATKPIAGLDLALSYAANNVNPTRSALGLDGTFKLGDFSVKGLFVTSKAAGIGGYFQDYFDPTKADWAYYVQGEAKLGPVGLKANYRAIDPQYANGVAGMSGSHLAYYSGVTGYQSPAPYAADSRGAGLNLSSAIGPVSVEAYGDTYYANYNGGAPTSTDLGISAKVSLFAGFSLTGAYDTSYTGTKLVDLATQTASTVTATLAHDGGAKDAAVKDLNLTLQGTYDTIATTWGLAAYATYKLGLGPISLDRILARYADPNLSVANDQTLKGGLQASLDLGGFLPFKPKLAGEVAARQTGGAGGTEELKWGVGLSLGEFLFPGSSAEVRYAQYRASKVTSVAVGVNDHAFAADEDRIYSDPGANSGTLAGFNVTWRYYDFRVDYGEYLLNNTDHARTFRVTYTVRF